MEDTPVTPKIELDHESLHYLNTTRKWTMFFAVLGFIGVGIILLGGIVTGIFLSAFKTAASSHLGFPEWIFPIFFLVFAVLYLFPIIFLYRFSKHTANAVATMDSAEMKKAFHNLKSYFVYIGVLTIILLALYVLAIIGAGVSFAFLKNLG
jgi:hypothetical protein